MIHTMPRYEYTKTKAGIVIGCAHIPVPSVPIDEHTQRIQNMLLKEPEDQLKSSLIAYIVVVCLVIAIAALIINTFPAHILLGR